MEHGTFSSNAQNATEVVILNFKPYPSTKNIIVMNILAVKLANTTGKNTQDYNMYINFPCNSFLYNQAEIKRQPTSVHIKDA